MMDGGGMAAAKELCLSAKAATHHDDESWREGEWRGQWAGSASAVQDEESKARWCSCDKRGQPRSVRFQQSSL